MADDGVGAKRAATTQRPGAHRGSERRAGAASVFWAAGVFGVFGVGGQGIGAVDVAAAHAPHQASTAPASREAAATPAAEEEQGLDCGPVSACTDKCGAACPSGIRKLGCLMSCKSDCRAKGCTSARKVFDDLTDCIAADCWTSCLSGPTPECRACTEKECAPEAKQCVEHKCAK